MAESMTDSVARISWFKAVSGSAVTDFSVEFVLSKASGLCCK